MNRDAKRLLLRRTASAGRLRAMLFQLCKAWWEDAEFFSELMDATRSLDDETWERLHSLMKKECAPNSYAFASKH